MLGAKPAEPGGGVGIVVRRALAGEIGQEDRCRLAPPRIGGELLRFFDEPGHIMLMASKRCEP
ncbi:hypothetical protein ATN84_11495 [Paramesorhizobium deserti]|uniref:Uncharacterized protein n=1 Tax=Paramesorhizobium deserti TaxID=1494590 RepID=A0A135HTY5_9HYPH|nr:hypothetical protein ATN84_11495 [Paramesorhizobium deserti]